MEEKCKQIAETMIARTVLSTDPKKDSTFEDWLTIDVMGILEEVSDNTKDELYNKILLLRKNYAIDHYPPAYWKEVAMLAIKWSKK